ncbi:MAG TPA: cytochrome c [Planctomycetota bacterium]|jgi:cytochrome c556|nr:cytochrome c [Planctomycetota bacterium]
MIRTCVAGASAAIASAIFAVLAVSSLPGSSARAEDAKKETSADGGYKMVAPLEAIMQVMDDSVFSKILDQAKAGKFKDVKREGLFLAEIANLTSQEKDHRTNKEWLGFTETMKAGALKLAEAADKKDEGAVKAQHAAMEKTCDACHEKFRDN